MDAAIDFVLNSYSNYHINEGVLNDLSKEFKSELNTYFIFSFQLSSSSFCLQIVFGKSCKIYDDSEDS